MVEPKIWVMVFAIYLAFESLLAFVLYAADKIKAKRGLWRVSEAALLGISFIGGALGGYLAMLLFRHKTRKAYFHFVNLVGILWQAALLVFLIVRFL